MITVFVEDEIKIRSVTSRLACAGRRLYFNEEEQDIKIRPPCGSRIFIKNILVLKSSLSRRSVESVLLGTARGIAMHFLAKMLEISS